MEATREVEVKIHSVIDNLEGGIPDGEPEISIFTADGRLTVSDGALTLAYRETGEGYVTLCELSVRPEGVMLSRREAVVCDILFSEEEECHTVYSVPPYKFDMTVVTKRIRNSLTAEGGTLQLVYGMNLGGQDKSVNMKITVRAK